jgi:FixJ family two-component response regulator
MTILRAISIFISGYTDIHPSMLRLDRPNVAFLAKPFRGSTLVAAVQELVA